MSWLETIGTRLRQILSGATGIGAYERHVRHLQHHHPEQPVPSRSEFARRLTEERWAGINRCC
jgi:uncharacterized short protein YbdD (DUF466 family)